MQEWMRKHRRLIMFFILVFIGIPMVILFGMPSGNRSPETSRDNVIAEVGGIPIMESEYRRQLDVASARLANTDAGRPSYRDLDRDGTAQRVLEQMIDNALVKIQEKQRSFNIDTSLLEAKLREIEWFKDENGNFNREAWNEWVGSITHWEEIYGELSETISRQVFMGAMVAPAGRVLERKIDEELLAEQTKLRVKHAKVGLAIKPTEEQFLAHYDENPDMYREPEVHQAEFVAISITPDPPELAYELIQRARDGEDFAALADEYSVRKQPEGGSMGWRRAGDFVSPHLEPFFDLSEGQVSEPVLGPDGYYIYRVESERINDEGQVELFGRQIVLSAELEAETLEARKQLAEEIAAKIVETDDIQSIASEYELEALRSSYFNPWKLEIDNVHHDDLYQFRGQMLAQMETALEPIVARRHIYIGKIIDTRDGDLPPLEEVRDKVIENIKNERRRTDEYQEHLAERIAALADRVFSIDDITDLDSDLEVETGETEEAFSRRDSLFQKRIYVQTNEIFKALEDKEEGEVGGPVEGLLGDYWFFQLIERDEPSPEKLADLKEERETIKQRLVQTAQFEYTADYVKDLRERMMASVAFMQDAAAFDRILGRDWDEDGEEPEAFDIDVDVDNDTTDADDEDGIEKEEAIAADDADSVEVEPVLDADSDETSDALEEMQEASDVETSSEDAGDASDSAVEILEEQ